MSTELCSDDLALQILWRQLQQIWFPDFPELNQFRVTWSKRKQKRTLAVCYTEQKKVTVARELNYPVHQVWIKPLLYHEMCHAVLGDAVSSDGRGRAWHGPEFKALEQRFPLTPLFKQWIDAGGWQKAIRSDRAKRALSKKKIKEFL